MDKNEIIERLERLARCAVHTVGELPFVMSLDDGIAIHEAIDMLRSQPEPHWIPCSERLPDEDYWTGANFQYSADVLMTVYNAEDEETIIDYGHPVDGSWYSDTTDCFVPSWWEVLAWMPLPEPYREDDHEAC